jgi:ribosome-binding factor A
MASPHRKERVEELLRSFIAAELSLIEEPLFSLITITSADISRDLRHATLYWCRAAGAPAEDSDAVTDAALKSAVPFLKKRIAEELNLRFVPSLAFKFDKTPFMSEHIDQLLKKAQSDL